MLHYKNQMKPLYLWRRSNREHPTTKKAPIMLRIEIAGFPLAEFATGVKATEAEWKSERQRLQASRASTYTEKELIALANTKLEDYLISAQQYYHNCKSQGGTPTPADVREFLRGGGRSKDHSAKELLVIADRFFEDLCRPYKKRSANTIRQRRYTIKKLRAYCQSIRATHVLASEINRAWCRQFEHWLLALPLSPSVVHSQISTLRRIIGFAADEGIIEISQVERYSYVSEVEHQPKRHLTLEELALLESTRFAFPGIQRAADMFIFCCYTGLSFVDYGRFAKTPKEFLATEENVLGIRMQRQKLIRKGKYFWVPLFPVARHLFFVVYNQQLPVFSNPRVSRLLKRVAAALAPHGFHLLDLKHKDARSTFSQHMRDKFGAEIAAGMAGHSKEIMDARYSDTSPKRIVQQITVLGGVLTDN